MVTGGVAKLPGMGDRIAYELGTMLPFGLPSSVSVARQATRRARTAPSARLMRRGAVLSDPVIDAWRGAKEFASRCVCLLVRQRPFAEQRGRRDAGLSLRRCA